MDSTLSGTVIKRSYKEEIKQIKKEFKENKKKELEQERIFGIR